MKIETLPKETLAELLLFLSEHENFDSVEKQLAGGITKAQVRAALRELAEGLMRLAQEENEGLYNPQRDHRLSKEAKTIISYLSPGEEKTLLTAFGLIESKKISLNAKTPRRAV